MCHGQRNLYNLTDTATVIYNGTPDPFQRAKRDSPIDFSIPTPILSLSLPKVIGDDVPAKPFTFLYAASVGPRKNQLLVVDLFQRFARNKRQSVKLIIVGARYIRPYEIEYIEKVRAKVGADNQIEILDTAHEMDTFYRQADAMLMTSLNEVAPMVICEALSWSLPIVATDIARIKKMIVDGEEGMLFAPEDETKVLLAMERIFNYIELRERLQKNARKKF